MVVNPLTVSVNKAGKKRLILDLRKVHELVLHQRIKFEDWKVALQLFTERWYMFKFDFKSGYHHVDVSAGHQTYLGFYWEQNYYCFTVLPFGLSSAPYIFTKCLRPLVKYWRSKFIDIVVYLDDGWGCSKTMSMCEKNSAIVLDTLVKAGFMVNVEKSMWNPVQSLEWLGFVWSSGDFSLRVPVRRLKDLTDSINSAGQITQGMCQAGSTIYRQSYLPVSSGA